MVWLRRRPVVLALRQGDTMRVELTCQHFLNTTCCATCHHEEEDGTNHFWQRNAPDRLDRVWNPADRPVVVTAGVCCGVGVDMNLHDRRVWADAVWTYRRQQREG